MLGRLRLFFSKKNGILEHPTEHSYHHDDKDDDDDDKVDDNDYKVDGDMSDDDTEIHLDWCQDIVGC